MLRWRKLFPTKTNSLYSGILTATLIITTTICLLTTIDVLFTGTSTRWVNTQDKGRGKSVPNITMDQLMLKYSKEFNDKVMTPLGRLISAINQKHTKARRLLLPKRVQLNVSQTFAKAENDSNLAATYWQWWNGKKKENRKNRKKSVNYCDKVRLTRPHKVRHNNLYWQKFDAVPEDRGKEVVHMFLYNAYYDKRIDGSPQVKLLTMNQQEMMANDRKWW